MFQLSCNWKIPIDREKKRGFTAEVKIPDMYTLMSVIGKHVKVGTITYTDVWDDYNNLPSLKYGHKTVFHKENFINPCKKMCILKVSRACGVGIKKS